jgi:hypothetical protein
MDLRDLQGDVPPPPALKARVGASLRQRGVLRPTRSRWLPLAAVVAGLALVGVGYAIGRMADGGRRMAAGVSQYALLLYEDRSFTTTVPEHALVAEYASWARDIASHGVTVSGEKLGATAGLLGAWGRDVPREGLAGFFVISAPSDSVAVAIANSCPHLRHGGRIVVRRIDPT